MSIHRNSSCQHRVAAHLRIRRRFWVWGLAIASSLTSFGLLSPSRSTAWAQDNGTTTEENAKDKQADSKPQTTDGSPVNDSNDASQVATQEFYQWLNSGEFEKASERIDTALQASPNDYRLNQLNLALSSYLSREDASKAYDRLKTQFDRLVNHDSLSSELSQVLAGVTNYLTRAKQDMQLEQKLELIDQVLQKLAEDSLQNASAIESLVVNKARALISEDQSEKAKATLDEIVSPLRNAVDVENLQSVEDFTRYAIAYANVLRNEFPEAVQELVSEATEIARERFEREEVSAADFNPFYRIKSSLVSSLSYRDPQKARAELEELREAINATMDRLSEDQAEQLGRLTNRLDTLAIRLESALAREELVGAPAPANLDAEHFIGMEPVTMDDLKGKVVLLDFWAVWCGPCIATFPHLKEWHEAYSEDGLVIIGITKRYGYTWDEDSNSAKRGGNDVTVEDELAMLEKFRESYELKHGFMVTGEDSDFSSKYSVTGIPQAVVIDQQGIVRLIRVGSGEENAQAIENKIAELLSR